ncbi:MAG: MFS transporter [Clostridiaceae bacterium]|nr:MFS transporter [Eubacteriales bacterium]
MTRENAPAAAGEEHNAALRGWEKNAALFIASQTLSLFGSALVQYAMSWQVLLGTKSGSMMTVSVLCGFLPAFFLSPFAGVWADRYDRKCIIMLADGFIALVTLALALLFSAGYDSLVFLFAAMALRAVGTGLHSPAMNALVPELIPANSLTRVQAINSTLQSVVTLLSPMLSAALLGFLPIQSIFYIDVVTASAAILILLFLVKAPKRFRPAEASAKGYFEDMAAGLRYVKEHGFIKAFFAFTVVFQFFAAPAAFLTPLQTARTFGEELWRLSAIEVAFSVGMIGGGLLIAAWGGFKNKVHSMAAAFIGVGAGTALLGVGVPFWLYLAFMAVIGISLTTFSTPAMVLLQQRVEPEFHGRIFSVMAMISSAVMPLGMLVFGPLADVASIELMLIGTGVIYIAESVILLKNRPLLEAGKPL